MPSPNHTILNDRTLWFDGDSSVPANKILDIILNGNSLNNVFVDELTPEIKQYNSLCNTVDDQILIKKTVAPPTFDWNIPLEYQDINIISYVGDKLIERDGDMPDLIARQERCARELVLYRKLELFGTIKVLIYIVNTLIKNDVIWGVGRGSSVSSYVLYLIGIHDIDSVHYNLNITDFLRSE